MNKGERRKRRDRNERSEEAERNMEGEEMREKRGSSKKERREEITLKPLISLGQTPSLCQGETQSEGQGLVVPLQSAAELEV